MVDLSAYSTLPVRSHAVSDALGLWEPKRTLTLEAARKHTQRIAFLRRALIAASIALTSLVAFYFAAQSSDVVIADDPDTSVRMVNPRYSGRTTDGLPFYLTSESATRQLENRNEVALNLPVLEFIRADGAESSFVEADSGTYDDVNKVLNLQVDLAIPEGEQQNVVLETDDGYRCITAHARIFARENQIVGDEPIRCTGNFGTVSGNTYEIIDNYRTFIFKDGMTGLINRSTSATELMRGTQASENTAPRPMLGFDGDGPIDVQAETATYYGGTTDLSGGVVVVQSGSTVYSDEMTILRDQAEPNASESVRLGAIRQITGTGNFRYVSDDNDVRGDVGVYQRDVSRVTVTGNVTVIQPSGNAVSTDRLVYDTVSETIRFSGQCQGRSCEGGDRVVLTIEQ